MKKVLFATTALVATAGVAAADVTFGGYGRFGILYLEDAAGNDSTDITSRLRLQIDMTAESDAGVVFGARVRIQQNNSDTQQSINVGPDGIAGTADDVVTTSGPAGTGFNGARFFARSGGLEVGVGNIYGALEYMPGQYPIDLGLTGLGYDYTVYDGNADLYSSSGDGAAGQNGVEVLYSAGDLSMHLSYSEASGTFTNNGVLVSGDRDRLAGYVAYNYMGYTFALGGQNSDDDSDTEVSASVSGTFGPADVTFAYADNGDQGDAFVLAGRFDVGAATDVEVYVVDRDSRPDTGYGIDFNHDLGGGTSLRGGLAKLSSGAKRADLGVRFDF
tara:strand:- start:144 stop:1136 length:993 start_codon:yes stop_codon:yes gene_type:complete